MVQVSVGTHTHAHADTQHIKPHAREPVPSADDALLSFAGWFVRLQKLDLRALDSATALLLCV